MTGTQEGRLDISEFTVAQANTVRSTRSFSLDIGGVPETKNVEIALELPPGPIFVGQKVPVAIEFRIDRQTQPDLVSYQVHVPLFDFPGLRFLDEPPPRTDTRLEIQTAAGVLQLPAVSSERMIGGRPALVVRAERTMIALAAEEIRVEAPKVFISQGAGFRRDVFNQRRPTSTEKFMAIGRPVRIEVAEVPRTGRPASFAGAVGSGFSLEVDADRSVVQLGEPIMLSCHLRGNGDLSSASLPALDAEGLFDPARFRLPEDSPAGIVDEDGKHFDVTLRVLDAGVREIPALAYSWFDAETRRFETTRSQPIALSVGAAVIIGADAVARRDSGLSGQSVQNGEAQSSDSSPQPPGEATERSTKLSLTGADLAVDRDRTRLLRDERAQGQNLAVTLPLYATGVAFLSLAMVMARRRAMDPRLLERRAALTRAQQAMTRAFALSDGGGAAALGRALRELVAALPSEASTEFDSLIEACDTLRFAPTSEPGTGQAEGSFVQAEGSMVPADLQDRARRLIDDLKKRDDDSEEDS
ncbi:MAG: hypothetical protein DRQ60_09585 [Gammaproteobacteria bacterium]|nr:MAG: hypothetical protein DRQ60_09585 [Gammaproteobacteria bacterium]